MRLHNELLKQARLLTNPQPDWPEQADLRRAVSTAYYALFHLLTAETATLFEADPTVAAAIGRRLDHGMRKEVSKSFAADKLPATHRTVFGPQLQSTAADPLKRVAETFSTMQDARHEADYDPTRTYTRNDAVVLVELTEKAVADWASVRETDLARLYLRCFFLWEKWNKER